MTAKIPFSALISSSLLALLAVNMNAKAYAPDGSVLDGVKGDPKLTLCALDTLDHFTVTVKSLDKAFAALTEDQITASLKARNYIYVDLTGAYATPYAARSGYGVSYSVKADGAKIAPAPVGFGAVAPPPKA